MTLPDPVFLATAIEIVQRAGDIQMARRESGFRIDKKGEIDLVTEVDLECERMCRALLAERFPDHDILAEELSSGPAEPPRARYRWVFDPLDGTTNYAHGLPIFCSSLALEIDGHAEVGAVYDPTRRELFTAERGRGAHLNGVPLKVSAATTCSTASSSWRSRAVPALASRSAWKMSWVCLSTASWPCLMGWSCSRCPSWAARARGVPWLMSVATCAATMGAT